MKEERLRALLVGVDTGGAGLWSLADSLDELSRLAVTADLEVVGRLSQKMTAPHNVTFLGSGKVHELKDLATSTQATVVVFDDELTPRQESALARELGDRIMVVDRTALILNIFADHATSREGKLQVELAQLEYELPRLRGKWSHLTKEKLGGASGARFGAGESQLESDRPLERRNQITALAELSVAVDNLYAYQQPDRQLSSCRYGDTHRGSVPLLIHDSPDPAALYQAMQFQDLETSVGAPSQNTEKL